MSAVTCTRAWPVPTTLPTMDSMRWRSRSSNSVVWLSWPAAIASGADLSSPPASSAPRSSMMATRSGLRLATAAATRCWIACTWLCSIRPRVFKTTEALGLCSSREKIWRSGTTRCTRELSMPWIVSMERDNSPSSARSRLMFCTKAVEPNVSDLSKNLVADAGGGEIVLRQFHAQLLDLVGGDEDRAGVALDLVRHVQRVELGGGRRTRRAIPGRRRGCSSAPRR